MAISLNWVNDYVNIENENLQELANKIREAEREYINKHGEEPTIIELSKTESSVTSSLRILP